MEIKILSVSTNVNINVVADTLKIGGNLVINGNGKVSSGELTSYATNDQKMERTVGRVMLGYTSGTTFNVFEHETGFIESILSNTKAIVADIEEKFATGTLLDE